jgi:hypothetical protein
MMDFSSSSSSEKGHSSDDENHSMKKKKAVSFAETATLITCCRGWEWDSPFEKENDKNTHSGGGWWNESDHETFLKTCRILAKKIPDEDDRQWLLNQQTGNDSTTDDDDDECWWCEYGHSRRGLEGLVSVAEGRTRRRIAKESIRLVLGKQQQIKNNKKTNHINENPSVGFSNGYSLEEEQEEIRNVYYHATTWCRTLAWAAAAADAEAVTTCCDQKPRPRAYFLSQVALQKKNNHQNTVEPLRSLLSSAGLTTSSVSDNDDHPQMDRAKTFRFPNQLEESVLAQICHRQSPNHNIAATTTTTLRSAITTTTNTTTTNANTLGISHQNHHPSTLQPHQCSSTSIMRSVDTLRA